MDDDDQDALAAEYVLGTLSAEERAHAEALLSLDPGFEGAVRHWERRLGELNVMVEAVEPPTEIWDKIKTQISPVELGDEIESLHEPQSLPPAAPFDLDLFPPAVEEPVAMAEADTELTAAPSPVPEPRQIERSADVIYLAGRLRRWQQISYGVGAVAALLALYVAVGQIAPGLIPWQMQPAGSTGPGAQTDRLVAVLQPGPTGPAFLLTLDTRGRTLTARRVSAKPEAGKSYQLWLISNQFGGPRSLGIVGNDEFTQNPLPGNYDFDTLRGATYAVSLEPAGGSTSNGPTGPVLFSGKAVESLPASPPPPPKT